MKDWVSKEIKEIGRVVTGKTPPTNNLEYFNGSELFVSPKDLGWNSHYITVTETSITSKALEKFKNQVIPKNAIMFTCLSFAFGKMGIASRPCLTNQQINSVIVNSENNAKFISYLLRAYEPVIFSYNSGIDTPIVPKSVFESIKVRVPNKKLQDKIAAILSAYDDLIENNQQRIKLLEKMSEEIYHEWFVRLRFPNYENERFEKGLPATWDIKPVKDIVDRKKFGRLYYEHELSEDGNVIIIDQSRNDYLGFYDGEPQHKATAKDPIILFGDHSCKMVLMTKPFSLAENVIPFKPKLKISTYFLYHLVKNLTRTIEYKRHWTDLTIKKVLVPSEHLQFEFEKLVKPNHEQIELLRSSISKLQKIRDALLPRLISGKLSVESLEIKFPLSMEVKHQS